MKASYKAIHDLRSIKVDHAVARVMQLPTFAVLKEREWRAPLAFVYEGDAWPTSIYPWHLCEVSCSYLDVAGDATQVATQWCPQLSSDEEPRGINTPNEDQVVQLSRFELVGTVFSVERYQFFGRNESELQSTVGPQYDRPVGPAIVRVITNEGGMPTDEKTAAHRFAQLHGEQLRHIFFHTFAPLVGVKVGQLEKKWISCVSNGISICDIESGGVSSVGQSSHDANEEACMVSPDVHVGLPNINSFSRSNLTAEGDCNVVNAFAVPAISPRARAGATSTTKATFTDLPLRRDSIHALFDQEERYHVDVVGGWARWTDGWDEVSRYAVVNSLDEIITSLEGSREAAHVAVAYLDAFLCMAQSMVRDPTYFSGVLLACAMLSCKQVDRFFPPIKSFLRCLRPESRIAKEEFLRYEMHVLETLDFRLQPVTSLEIVEILLHLCSGPLIQENAEEQHRQREQRRWCDGRGSGGVSRVYGGDCFNYMENLRWNDLCKLARFLNDLMLRSTRGQGYRRTVLGLAVVAVAAEKTGWALPAPLADLLATSAPTEIDASEKVELDSDSYELLVSFATTLKCRDEQDADTLSTGSLRPVVELVRECYWECTQRPVDGVLRRRYDMHLSTAAAAAAAAEG
ncbi:exportin 1 [Trypanosoma grayi]|uniref:exportin 1 n=1 Tax=Trypanosoma grayi TaxID=71804 RepID=UPI0004F3F19E|nr:exportin 1 [Trypanosoma grayi]KEG11429.1 exportin 1 [Trypanosoma grayi]